MSEYGEKHSVSRLIGAPPGYVGYENAGILTESVRRRPYQVLLLDEFEKAHREVWNIFLQLFDEGHLTDSHGRKVDFRNVIVIMTSNLGATLLADLPNDVLGSEPEVQESVMGIVRQKLSPELLNRIDDTIVFNRLQRENMDTIAAMGLADVARRLEEGHSVKLDVSTYARDVLAERGYDIRYGARPLKRTLARDLLHPLSHLILEGSITEGEIAKVRTRAEAENEQIKLFDGESTDIISSTLNEPTAATASFGWISSNPISNDRNDVVIMKNRLSENNMKSIEDFDFQDDEMNNEGVDEELESFLRDGSN